MPATPAAPDHPADRAVRLVQRTRELLLECRAVAAQLQAGPSQGSESAAAERIAYGVLVAALEEGLVSTLQHAMDVLRRFGTPAGGAGGVMAQRAGEEPRRGRALMVPPIWLDESGAPRPVRPCLRCGREAPIYRFRLEHLRMIGWRLFAPAEYVNWCGHAQEFVPVPDEDGWCRLVPVIGEAT